MTVEIFTFCEAASVEIGIVNITRAFDAFVFKDLPGHRPKCFLAGRIRVEAEGKYHFMVQFRDPDGKPFWGKIETDVTVAHSSEHSYSIPVEVGIENLLFQTAGRYSMSVSVNGREVFSAPFFVKRRDSPMSVNG